MKIQCRILLFIYIQSIYNTYNNNNSSIIVLKSTLMLLDITMVIILLYSDSERLNTNIITIMVTKTMVSLLRIIYQHTMCSKYVSYHYNIDYFDYLYHEHCFFTFFIERMIPTIYVQCTSIFIFQWDEYLINENFFVKSIIVCLNKTSLIILFVSLFYWMLLTVFNFQQ